MTEKKDKKFEILACTVDEDQTAVATQWANTFIYNNQKDVGVTISQLLLASIAQGDFKIRACFSKSEDWQDPSDQLCIVDYISHASRVILDYKQLNEVNKKKLLAYFSPEQSSVIARTATHTITRNSAGEVKEEKGIVIGIKGALPSILKEPEHFGINIAMGGEGQLNFHGNTISADGCHGHLYFTHNSEARSFLLGLEQTAPAESLLSAAAEIIGLKEKKKDQFGQSHSNTGGADTHTAAGSFYFRNPIYQAKLMLEKGIFPPTSYGGMKVTLTDANWKEIEAFLTNLKNASTLESKDTLIQLLKSKPRTTNPQAQEDVSSYIALDFECYLNDIYQMVISGSNLEKETKSTLLGLQTTLSTEIKKLQYNSRLPHDKLNNDIDNIINKSPPEAYKKALFRIKKLFELQNNLDPEFQKLQQESCLKNEYVSLNEQRLFIEDQLRAIKEQLLRQGIDEYDEEIKEKIEVLRTHNPFSEKDDINLLQSFVILDPWKGPPHQTAATINKLQKILKSANKLLEEIKKNKKIYEPIELIFKLHEKFSPFTQIDPTNYKTPEKLSELIKHFNSYLDEIASTAEQFNLWGDTPEKAENIIAKHCPLEANKKTEFVNGYAFLKCYRESTLLKKIFTMNSSAGTNRLTTYDKGRNQKTETSWDVIEPLLTAGQDLINGLQLLSRSDFPAEDVEEQRNKITECVKKFQKEHATLISHLEENSKITTPPVFTSPFFFSISDEELEEMTGEELATVCLEELHSDEAVSDLLTKIVSNQTLWDRMDEAFNKVDELKGRADNPIKKIEILRQRQRGLILENQAPVTNGVDKKGLHSEEIESSIEQEFKDTLDKLKEKVDFVSAYTLNLAYQKLPEHIQKKYQDDVQNTNKNTYEKLFEQLHSSEPDEMKQDIPKAKDKIVELSLLFKCFSEKLKEKFQKPHDVKLSEFSLYNLCDTKLIKNVGSMKSLFKSTSIIEDFKKIDENQTAASAKNVLECLTLAKSIYENLTNDSLACTEVNALIDKLSLKKLSNVNVPLYSRFIETALQDPILKQATQKTTSILPKAVNSLLKIKEFRDKKTEQFKDSKDPAYKSSIDVFYTQAVQICLSGDTDKEKELKTAAKKAFPPRHTTRRLLADALLMISCLCGVGILIGAGRKAAGKTWFFSNMKSSRYTEFKQALKPKKEQSQENETDLGKTP